MWSEVLWGAVFLATRGWPKERRWHDVFSNGNGPGAVTGPTGFRRCNRVGIEVAGTAMAGHTRMLPRPRPYPNFVDIAEE